MQTDICWTAALITRTGYAHRTRLAEHVIADLAKLGHNHVTRGVASFAQQFMEHEMDEDSALVAAYTLCFSFNNLRV